MREIKEQWKEEIIKRWQDGLLTNPLTTAVHHNKENFIINNKRSLQKKRFKFISKIKDTIKASEHRQTDNSHLKPPTLWGILSFICRTWL
jgi:hypothetical protein